MFKDTKMPRPRTRAQGAATDPEPAPADAPVEAQGRGRRRRGQVNLREAPPPEVNFEVCINLLSLSQPNSTIQELSDKTI